MGVYRLFWKNARSRDWTRDEDSEIVLKASQIPKISKTCFIFYYHFKT